MKNPRINVTFDEATVEFLSQIADKKQQSLSSLVKDLALEALEDHEDFFLNRIAENVEAKGGKPVSHEDAWK